MLPEGAAPLSGVAIAASMAGAGVGTSRHTARVGMAVISYGAQPLAPIRWKMGWVYREEETWEEPWAEAVPWQWWESEPAAVPWESEAAAVPRERLDFRRRVQRRIGEVYWNEKTARPRAGAEPGLRTSPVPSTGTFKAIVRDANASFVRLEARSLTSDLLSLKRSDHLTPDRHLDPGLQNDKIALLL